MNISWRISRSGLGLVTALLVLAGALGLRAAEGGDEGIAIAIVYDTSGSMNDPVMDGPGRTAPKFRIASRALTAIVDRLQAVAAGSAGGPPRKLEAGLFVFQGTRAAEAVKFGPFNAEALRDWMKNFSAPAGATPLGAAVELAGRTVLGSRLNHKHVLVLTDGMNTAGPDPATVLPELNRAATRQNTGVSFHFVAFDVDAGAFARVKKQGATVLGAADAKQLNTQLEFILAEKILLEADEPAAGAKPTK